MHHTFDLNGDGLVDIVDLLRLKLNWPGCFGWKTSGEEQFEDDAVWTEVSTFNDDPHVVPSGEIWNELRYPASRSLDLAFVITGEEEEEEDPKHKNLKWSQPPIEWDPMVDPPRYCGWDEMSLREWIEHVEPFWFDCWDCRTQCHGDADCDGDVDADDEAIMMLAWLSVWPIPSYDPCPDFNHDLTVDIFDLIILNQYLGKEPPADCAERPQSWQMAADDFRCLGSMPVTSVHWWGSHQGWEEPDIMPPDLPIAWRIGFWSNVPADSTADPNYSHPDKLVWQIEVPEDRVDVKEVGMDEYPEIPYYDICYQYYLDLEPDEIFWQNHYNTMDDIYWLSIAAVYDPCMDDPQYPWGWKTRPWSWMDDAVRFWVYENPVPGMVIKPEENWIEPIEEPVFGESFDLAFELNTDPNYIKYEQPFTGIRDWPHYEDEKSMATEVTIVEPVSKYLQPPDLSPNGIDVDATDWDDGIWTNQILADDFNCTTTGAITDIHIWGSWYHDYPFPEDVEFALYIFSDNPVGPDGWSEPNEWLWEQYFTVGEFDVSIEDSNLEEGYYVPCEPYYEPFADTICYRYDFYIDPNEAFYQYGDPCNPVVYWLVVAAYPLGPVGPVAEQDEPIRFGWKTSKEHWNDDAVWWDSWDGRFVELRYPTTQEEETEFYIDRLVADDWPCDNNVPVTAAAWWGSYIGYQYAACDIMGPWMPLPVKPKYFWLTIWDDVPATVDTKYAQLPDPCGWDICLCNQVADDFNCGQTGPITDIHFWMSWREDIVGEVNNWEVEIWNDMPGNAGAGPLWTWNGVGNVTTYLAGVGPQGYFCPCDYSYWIDPPDHQNYYKVDIDNIRDPFIQQAGSAYWLVIRGNFITPCAGWKTSVDTWPSAAVYWDMHTLTWNELYDPCTGNALNLAFEITTGDYSHPNDVIWKYKAYDYDEVLVGYDKHPHFDPNDPTTSGREPVFRYSVRLPEEDWFCQEEPNNVYWFSVVAVYDEDTANYAWGWTNHEHVYNDDAVAGYLEPGGPEPMWFWEELYDQNNVSEDMSFILFTEPECFPDTDPAYANWVTVGRPGSWCCKYQNQGDCNGDGWVNLFDLWIFKPSYNKAWPDPAYNPDGDFNHDKAVNLFDLWIFKPNYNTLLGPGYDCPYDGPYQPPCP